MVGMERVGSGMPGTTVEPSGGVMGLNQQNNQGRSSLDGPGEVLTTVSICFWWC